MAGAGSKLFTSGAVLTADQVNTYLMDQAVMRFSNAAARTAAFGGAGEATLASGMVSYLVDVASVQVYNGSAWVAIGGGADILQVQVFS